MAAVVTTAFLTLAVPTPFFFVDKPQGSGFAGHAEGVWPTKLPANVVKRVLSADAE